MIVDLCLCEYTSHGHCGLLREDGAVDNDATLELLARTAVSQARAGADIIAPSDMMDGRVGAIRAALDEDGLRRRADPRLQREVRVRVLRAVPRGRGFDARVRRPSRLPDGSRATAREAVREALLDVDEGADLVMVKPALPYLDVIRRVRRCHDAADRRVQRERRVCDGEGRRRRPGWLDERAAVLETLTAIRRAGADIVISYHAKDAARWLQDVTATPKTRSRKDGAAVPLSDLDRRLLNLMQGSFPLDPRPYAKVAAEAGITEEQVLADLQRLLADRIIRQITPIYDTRALGYDSMLVAAKVDPEHPWRAAKIINAHPGVSHNYLRNHEFNMWFTLATEEDSKLGLQGTLDVLRELTGAESIRQLPTLKLFKIRMDLEMEGDTRALASQGVAAMPIELERRPYDEFDKDVIRATQGDLPVVPEPWAPSAAELGVTVPELLAHLEGMRERGLLRRVAAILFHRRAGFSANGMGVWQVPEDRILEIGPQMAAFRGISHCYQRPTYEDWPYQIFTMAHGRSKEECDAILDAIADAFPIEDRATLYSSTEFKKIRLLYFTDDFRAWEREHAGV